MGQNLPGSSHDPRGNRPPRPSRHNPRNECRQLSAKSGCRQGARSGTSTNARDKQRLILIVAPRQSNHASRKYRLRYRRAATNILSPDTAKMAILIVAVFPSRLSRYIFATLAAVDTANPYG